MSSRSSRSTSAVIRLLVVALLVSTLILARHLPAASARHVVVFKQVKDDATGQAETAGGSSRPARTSTVEMRGDAAAAAEMQGMLRRDYAYRARRRSPIHNDEPLQEDEEP